MKIHAAVLVLLAAGPAAAAQLVTGALPVAPADSVRCSVVNLGRTAAADVAIRVTFNRSNGSFSSIAADSCSAVLPERSCRLSAVAISGNDSMSCRVDYKGGKLRGTLCNVTRGLCTDLAK